MEKTSKQDDFINIWLDVNEDSHSFEFLHRLPWGTVLTLTLTP